MSDNADLGQGCANVVGAAVLTLGGIGLCSGVIDGDWRVFTEVFPALFLWGFKLAAILTVVGLVGAISIECGRYISEDNEKFIRQRVHAGLPSKAENILPGFVVGGVMFFLLAQCVGAAWNALSYVGLLGCILVLGAILWRLDPPGGRS